MLEIWRTAIYDGETYEGLYKVSNLGRLLNLNYKRTGKAEVMTPVERKDGYLQVGLSKNGKKKLCLVHRLVAFAFLENPENKPQVNHLDEDKTNNSVWNLEWCSPKENCNHGTRNERRAKTQSKPVLQLSLSGELIREWSSTMECERNGFSHGAVVLCCNGKQKTYKGFVWKYKGEE